MGEKRGKTLNLGKTDLQTPCERSCVGQKLWVILVRNIRVVGPNAIFAVGPKVYFIKEDISIQFHSRVLFGQKDRWSETWVLGPKNCLVVVGPKMFRCWSEFFV